MKNTPIQNLEMQIGELSAKLRKLQAEAPALEVPNYTFTTLEGETSLRDLFGKHDTLIAIHNMGKGCRYCTLWADGLNAFVPHLESTVSLALLSKDSPEEQRKFANDRGWRMRMVSHGGGTYMAEQGSFGEHQNYPGVVCYHLEGDKIVRKASSFFGPGDLYCSIWHFLGLAGIGLEEWTPQFSYWKRPAVLEDGGQNLLD